MVWEFWAEEEELLTHFLGQFSLNPPCFSVKHQVKIEHFFKDRSPFCFTAVGWSSRSRPVRNDSTGCEELGYSPAHLELMK